MSGHNAPSPPSTRSAWWRVLLTGLLAATLLGLLPAGAALGPAPAMASAPGQDLPPLTYQEGYRFDLNGWIYLHVQGDAYERGVQHGYLLADEIERILAQTRELVYWNTGMDWDYFVQAAQDLYLPNAEDEFLTEIKGIADGAHQAGVIVTWQDILTWNASVELLNSWWPHELAGQYGQQPVNTSPDHCSAFIATGDQTSNGDIVMAHNSWDDYASAQNLNLIVDVQPSDGHRFLMQSAPGFIASMTDFFVTDAGLMGTETTFGGFNAYDTEGQAEFFRARRAMQYADNLDDFVSQMLDGNNGGYASGWLLGDRNSGEIMRFELGLQYRQVERTQDGYYIGFNVPYDPRIRNLESSDTGFADIRRHEGARQVRLTQLMEEYAGRLDVQAAQLILADHYDVYLQKDNAPSARTVDGHYELDAREYVSDPSRPLPFQPRGTVDGKVMDSQMAADLSFWARWGNSSGMPFDAQDFLDQHIQWRHLADFLVDRPSQPWTQFSAGQEGSGTTAATGAAAGGRIQFGVGESAAVVSGQLPAGGQAVYELQVQASQTLSVSVSAPNAAVLFSVAGVDGQVLKKNVEDSQAQTQWSGQVPSSQDYLITLTAVADTPVSFALHVEVPPMSQPETGSRQLTEENDGQTITLVPGDVLTVTLESNATTGYQWQYMSGDPAVIKQAGAGQYVAPDSSLLGAPGHETFRFQATGLGQTVLELVYVRPWETGVAPARTFEVTVVVQ